METPAAKRQQISSEKWSNLPNDILLHIVEHHGLKSELHRLRAVCSSWRTTLSPEFPSNLGPCFKTPKHPHFGDHPLFLLETRFYFLSPLPESGDSWVAKMVEIGPSKWHLLNPVNDHKTLDYFHSDPPIKGKLGLNLLDCRVLELAKPMYLVQYQTRPVCVSERVVGGWVMNSKYKFVVLVVNDYGLMLWRLGDQEWVDIVIQGWGCVLDIALHNGKFYVFLFNEDEDEDEDEDGAKWRIGVIDPENKMISMQFIDKPDFMVSNDKEYELKVDGILYELRHLKMVISNKELYVCIDGMLEEAHRWSSMSRMFVYMIKEQEEGGQWEWVRMTKLCDEAFFLGFGHGNEASFAIPSLADNLPKWKPSTICWWFPTMETVGRVEGYGKESSWPECPLPKGLECLNNLIFPEYDGYYNLFNIQVQAKLLKRYLSKKDHMLYRGLFFPPPPWVKWHCPSLDNVEVSFCGLCIDDEEDDDTADEEDDDFADEEEEQDDTANEEDDDFADE